MILYFLCQSFAPLGRGGRTGHDAEMGKERRNQRCWISGS
ncbi:hypothetical protein GCWU000341_00758 [Oribacterium sp. oral taxon 078 str. F0262]|nr:hypothetical protein GCWU000341_00758 [Oribacterium sp. oral taxon 078 str. F0262]